MTIQELILKLEARLVRLAEFDDVSVPHQKGEIEWILRDLRSL